MTITFGTGKITGRCFEDEICVGALCSRGKFVASVSETDEPFGQFAFDGVLGLSLEHLSQGPEFSFVTRLTHANNLVSRMFSVYLSDRGSSEIVFGQVRAEHMDSQLVWVDVSRPTGYWEVRIEDIALDGRPQGLCEDCRAAVDTGTSQLAAPSHLVAQLAQLLQVSPYCVNFASLPKLGFVVAGHILELEPDDYVERSASGGSCQLSLMGLDVPPPRGPLFVVGIPFLQRYVTVYDPVALKIGFAKAKATAPTTFIAESQGVSDGSIHVPLHSDNV